MRVMEYLYFGQHDTLVEWPNMGTQKSRHVPKLDSLGALTSAEVVLWFILVVC